MCHEGTARPPDEPSWSVKSCPLTPFILAHVRFAHQHDLALRKVSSLPTMSRNGLSASPKYLLTKTYNANPTSSHLYCTRLYPALPARRAHSHADPAV